MTDYIVTIQGLRYGVKADSTLAAIIITRNYINDIMKISVNIAPSDVIESSQKKPDILIKTIGEWIK